MTTPVISPPPGASQPSAALQSLTSSAGRQARQVSRELAAFGASTITGGSVGGWLATTETSSTSTFITLDAIDASPIASGVLARDQGGDSANESHTSGPAPGPGPAPGGAGGGSAAGAGSSGASASASSMLMETLPHTAPSAMQRLCASQPSWQTSFFALFPERPG
jgi:hypothetical protein